MSSFIIAVGLIIISRHIGCEVIDRLVRMIALLKY